MEENVENEKIETNNNKENNKNIDNQKKKNKKKDNKKEEEEIKFNLSILGESLVGKTTMASVFLGQEFDITKQSTIGLEYLIHKMTIEEKKCKFLILDTAGQERYRSLSASTLQISDGYLVVFAVDDPQSFERVSYWIKTIQNSVNIETKVIYLVGNKIDVKDRKVSQKDATEFAKNNKLEYFECSAKSGEGIQDIFLKIFKDLFDLKKKMDENKELGLLRMKSFNLEDKEREEKDNNENNGDNNNNNKDVQKGKKCCNI